MPRVSVIIPCFNHGGYLDETVASVLAQSFRDFEIIVVNDGSTDDATLRLLAASRWPQTRVIHTANQGVAMARNNGIREAQGEYILPLDADDLIAPTYLEKTVAVLDRSAQTGIVYSHADCFGSRKGFWPVPDFSRKGMLLTNLIFCSALFRRQDWERVGGYNPNMISGWEDWDFWISLLELGREVYRIPEVLFSYRIVAGSRERSMDRQKQVAMHLQLMRNHPGFFVEQSQSLLELYYRIRSSGFYRLLKRLRIPQLAGRFLRGKK